MLALFDQEEIGLVGSRALAGSLDALCFTIEEAHTIDQVGWDADDDRVFELELPTQALRSRYESVAPEIGASTSVTNTPSSDHSAFREIGIDAVGITEEYVGGDTTPDIRARAPDRAPAGGAGRLDRDTGRRTLAGLHRDDVGTYIPRS